MSTVRSALAAIALCLFLRVGYGLPVPQEERIANLQARIDADLAHIEALTGGEGAAQARRWAAAATRLLPTADGRVADGEAIAIAGIEDDLFARLDRGFSGMRRVFSLNLQLSAVRASALLGSLPLGILALAAGAANGCASRHVRRCRLMSASAFVFGAALACGWLACAWFFAYVLVPIPLGADVAAWIGWTAAGTAVHFACAYFGGGS